VVSNDARHAQRVLDGIPEWIERKRPDLQVVDHQISLRWSRLFRHACSPGCCPAANPAILRPPASPPYLTRSTSPASI